MAEATIKVHFKNFSDTILLSSGFYNFFPNDYIEGPQKKLYGDGTEYISLKIQIPQKVELNFSEFQNDSLDRASGVKYLRNDSNVTCFLFPSDTLTIKVDYIQWNEPNQSIIFDGKYSLVSKYYQDKATYFSGIDFIYQKGMLANTASNFTSFKNAIDSITLLEISFLNDYDSKNKLPKWFLDYENSDLNYFAFSIKLDEPVLNELLNGSTMQIPENYYSFTKELPLQNDHAILSIYYFLGLRSYFMMNWEPMKLKEIPSRKSKPIMVEDFVQYSRSQFSSYISDVLLARELDMLIDMNRIIDDEYTFMKEAITNVSLKSYLESRFEHRQILKQGNDAPYFYLKNDKNEYLSLYNFKDSIVYLSFWFTGCKPCIKEFPEENRLVDIFKNEAVKIITICMYSKEDDWRNLTHKYKLKSVNFYATGNWETILKESYGISGFPHNVIIDKNGKII
jgi:peroxiredoxin